MLSKSLIPTEKLPLVKQTRGNSSKQRRRGTTSMFNNTFFILFATTLVLLIMVQENECRKTSGYSKMSHRKTNAALKPCPKGYNRNSQGKCEKISFVQTPPVVISAQGQNPNRVFVVRRHHNPNGSHRRVFTRPQRYVNNNNRYNNFNPFIQRLSGFNRFNSGFHQG